LVIAEIPQAQSAMTMMETKSCRARSTTTQMGVGTRWARFPPAAAVVMEGD
jgi:hypothetical protein